MFASRSQATGCHVKIRNSSVNISDTSINISRSGDSQSHTAEQTVTEIAPGGYEVLIFDWEKNGSVASTPSYEGHVSVTDIPIINITNSFAPTMTTTVTRPDPSPTNGRMTTIVAIATK